MWTNELIVQAIGWSVLIVGLPLIFIYVRKITLHIAYALYPRDMLIQYKASDDKVESYILKRSILRGKTLTRVSEGEARALGGSL
jgi:hypothetical protein